MIRWLTPPKLAEIAKYVECYWYLEKSVTDIGIDRPKLNPDPSAHLILSLPKQPFHYSIGNVTFTGNGSHWLFPHSQTFELDHSGVFAYIGIKFKVGALYSLNQGSFDQAWFNTVKSIDFTSINITYPYNAKSLMESAVDAELCCELIDKLLQPLFADCYEDKHSEITRKIIPLLADIPINQLAETLFCSQRTLERSFLKVTALTLKQCQSMNKLELILEYLYQRKQHEIDWVDVAFQFGFSDQPHFIRYLKQQINLTPKSYALERGFTIDVYGGVGSE